MDLSIFAIVIGVLSCIIYIALSGGGIGVLVYLAKENDGSKEFGTLIILACLLLIFYLTMALISGLLIMGVRKRRADLVAPWLFLTLAGIFGSTLNLFINGYKQPTKQIILSIVYILLDAAIWYPIYKLWRELRAGDGEYRLIVNQEPPPQPLIVGQQPAPNYDATAATTGGYQRGHVSSSEAA